MLQRTSRSLTLLLGVQSALPPLSIDMSLPALPAVGAALGASAGATQWTLSTFLLGFAVGQLVFGPASDRFGRRPVLVAGLILYVLAGAATTIASSIDQLILGRLLQGLGACAGVVVSRAVVRDVFEDSEGVSRQSLLSAIATLAMLMAPMIGAVLLHFIDWRAIYGVLTASGLALLVVTATMQPESQLLHRSLSARSA
jgi:DHA1 family bicyclomycin/chloramphenicol resistance-like MFS transporter